MKKERRNCPKALLCRNQAFSHHYGTFFFCKKFRLELILIGRARSKRQNDAASEECGGDWRESVAESEGGYRVGSGSLRVLLPKETLIVR